MGLQSEATLFRVYVQQLQLIILSRAQDFKQHNEDRLPSIISLLDGLSRKSDIESLLEESGEAEDLLHRALQVYLPSIQASHSTKYRRVRNDNTPRSFREALNSPAWSEIIDRE